MRRIELVQGDITREEVDAIVNAANKALAGGGGVDGAIHSAGGPSILEECRRIIAGLPGNELPTGQAVATGAGDLRARWVIHTAGPVYGSPDAEALLKSCHLESLRVADELGATTVAFPAISTGVYGYPAVEAAPVALRAVMEARSNVEQVRFVLFDAPTVEIFERAAKNLGITPRAFLDGVLEPASDAARNGRYRDRREDETHDT
jgi:O-acetyl-ADP-ribose deacetylase (regulator of RNase III)